MSAEIISLSSFNADLVTTYFFVKPHDIAALAAMRFMFKIYGEEIPLAGEDRTKKAKTIAECTIEKIEFPYRLFENYFDDFMPGCPRDIKDAVAIAIICDEYTVYANDPSQPDKSRGQDFTPRRNDGFDDYVLGIASYSAEQATDLMQITFSEEDKKCTEREVLFLMHVHWSQHLHEIEINLKEHGYSTYDLNRIVSEDLPRARTHLVPETKLGRELAEHIDHMEKTIKSLLLFTPPQPPDQPAPTKPRLNLVPSNP